MRRIREKTNHRYGSIVSLTVFWILLGSQLWSGCKKNGLENKESNNGIEATDASREKEDGGKNNTTDDSDVNTVRGDSGTARVSEASTNSASAASTSNVDCGWDGSLCTSSMTRVCEDGVVIAETNCDEDGCLDETGCVAPGGRSAEGRRQVGAAFPRPKAPKGLYDIFAEDEGCGSCLNDRCCTESRTCWDNQDCIELLSCFNDCDLDSCESNCLILYAQGVDYLIDLVSCAASSCPNECEMDVCANFPFDGYGYSCGSNLTSAADPDELYLCDSTQTVGVVVCHDGCYAAPLGELDYCHGEDPCAGSPYNGYVCGDNLPSPNASENTYYECEDQQTISKTDCSICLAMPPGQEDICIE